MSGVNGLVLSVVAGGIVVLACLSLLLLLLIRKRRGAGQQAVDAARHDADALLIQTAQATTIVDHALDAIVAMNQDGRIIAWNAKAESMFGWNSAEALGLLMSSTIIPERYRSDHERGLSHYLRTGEGPMLGRSVEISAVRKDGHEFPIELSINAALGAGAEVVFVAFLRDITDRKRLERLQSARLAMATVLSSANGVPEALERVVAALGSSLDCAMVSLWAPGLGGMRSDRQWADDPDQLAPLLAATRDATLAAGTGLPGRAWQLGRPVRLHEASAGHGDFDRAAAAGEAGLRDGVAIPVSSDGRVLAVVELLTRHLDLIDDELVRTLTDLANQLGEFVARRRAEALQDSPERLQALLEDASDSLVTFREDGAIVALNARARRSFGYSTLEIMGEDFRLLIEEGSRASLLLYIEEWLRHERGGPPPAPICHVVCRRRDGSAFPVALHATPLSVGGHRLYIALLIPEETAEAVGEERSSPYGPFALEPPRLA